MAGTDINGFLTLVSAMQNLVTALNTINQTVAAVFPPPLTSTYTYAGGTLTNGSVTQITVPVTNAALKSYVTLSFSATLSGIVATAYVSAAGIVTIVLYNGTGASVTLPAGTFEVWVRSK